MTKKRKTIEVDCRKCVLCNGNECIAFGKDANEATKKCASENFARYTTREKFNEAVMREKPYKTTQARRCK